MQERRDSDRLAFMQLGESDPASLSETDLKAEGEIYFEVQFDILTCCASFIATTKVKPIAGKLDSMERHARNCALLSPEKFGSTLRDDIIKQLNDQKNKENIPFTTVVLTPTSSAPVYYTVESSSSPSLSANQLKRKQAHDASSFGDLSGEWSKERQRDFSTDFCRLLVANSLAWNFAANPETLRFFGKWVPNAQVPDRRDLGGRVLDAEAARVKELTKAKVEGKIGTGQCDGWKNIAKKPVISTMVTVENEVR